MDWNGSTRIRSEALAEWKAFFARHVAVKAKELAQNSNPPGLVTLDHYRQAAVLAVQLLAIEVHDTESDNGRQEAARTGDSKLFCRLHRKEHAIR